MVGVGDGVVVVGVGDGVVVVGVGGRAIMTTSVAVDVCDNLPLTPVILIM